MKCSLALCLALPLVAGVADPLAWAVTYRCVDPTGHTVFTDSPSQLSTCTIVHKGHPTEAAQPARQSTSELGSSSVREESTRATVEVTVPIHRAGRSLVVHARLNGERDAKFIVDTGADITLLSHEVVRDLGLVPTASAPTITLNTVGGTVRADMIRVGAITVGEAEVRNVMVAVHDLPNAPIDVDGLLGLSFLDQFLVKLDAQEGKLHLVRRK